MKVSPSVKEQLLSHIKEQLDQKVVSIQQAIDSAIESRDSETKSSVGDKYETGRAMMQNEIDKNKAQLSIILKQKQELEKIDATKTCNKVEFGSILKTNFGNYFISIGIGKVNIDNENWYCISVSSPIGQVLFDKNSGDMVQFQGKEIKIQKML